MDDRALIDAVRAGDRAAFGLVVDRETRSVYRACLRILGTAHDAEEATQESFVAAYRAAHSFRGDGTIRAWLLRIATREAFRRLRHRREVSGLDAVAPWFLLDSSAEPTRIVVAEEEREMIRAAVAALPEAYREVVALRFFGELSLSEIADVTGRPLNTVKTHLRRGLERLRPLIALREADR